MADLSHVRSNYVTGLQRAATLVIQLSTELAQLDSLYQGGGLSGTFTDEELAAAIQTKHLTASDIGTYTANLNTVSTALTTAIVRNMAKAVGNNVE